MPRTLSVSDVRRSLYWAAGGPAAAGQGEPSAALLGTIFHGLFAALTGADERVSLVRPLERADASLESWQAELTRHTYAWHVGPALARHHADLRGLTPQVLAFWQAVRQLCSWLAEVVWTQRHLGRTVALAREQIFRGSEREIAVEMREAGWTDSVVVEGRADALVAQPGSGTPCVVELKLGRGAPEADLCQAALYHALLAAEVGQEPARLALLAFTPAAQERLFEAAALREAQGRLKALVGRLAGVLPETRSHPRALPPPVPAVVAREQERPKKKHQDLGVKLVKAFREFGVELSLDGDPLVGPRFLRFFAEPARGVRAREVEGLASSVWMRLKTDQPPQIALHGGRIAIDVARPDPQTVPWATLRAQLPQPRRAGTSRFPVGVAVDGSLRWADLAEPQDAHFLVAGTTGSGKSEWQRAMVASLLASNTPETLGLVLIDPKRLAFSAFGASRFLRRPVVYPSDEDVTAVFAELIDEMEARYGTLSAAGVADLASFNAGTSAPMPRLVCLCDEYADLILRDRKQRQTIEEQIARLGSKARAAGIHLVFATQRASREVVRGVIDVNLTARVALKVPKDTDSRLVIDHPGAATLLGKGDLLFKDLGDPVRLQSPLVSGGDLRALL